MVMIRYLVCLVLILLVPICTVESRNYASRMGLRSKVKEFVHGGTNKNDEPVGTRWAVLIAGSNGYENYRHQANVCHAYQILKKGGLKDENIVVFMYDDIAFDPENPRPGVVINSPHGSDVYAGVPKDYTGEEVNTKNFYAAILGNKSAIVGGSGKVVDSGPEDHIFIYYGDHGGPGILGIPSGPDLYAVDLIDVLIKKSFSGAFQTLVFYVEACESGSIFDGLLPKGLNIYATTAANSYESSWGTYCPGEYPSPPSEYDTCLGDLYSIAWLEDSDKHDLRVETLQKQYELVARRTLNENFEDGSHVMQYGDVDISSYNLWTYMGTNPANDNYTLSQENSQENSLSSSPRSVNQYDAELLHFWHKFRRSPEGSRKKEEALNQYYSLLEHRVHIDHSMNHIGKILFGFDKGPEVLKAVRPAGKPVVDNWECLKSMVRTYETRCGSLHHYGKKHMRSLANICNAGVENEKMAEASAQACVTFPSNPLSSLQKGFSA